VASDYFHAIPSETLTLIARACFNHAVTVFWGQPDQNPGINSGSGVLLKIDDDPFLVTAAHVVDHYLERLAIEPSLKLQIAKGSIAEVAQRIIAKTVKPDLVTLNMSGIDIKSFAEHLEYHEPPQWPSQRVVNKTEVILSGFPMAYREVLFDYRAIKFDSFNLKAVVETVQEDHFTLVVDADKVKRTRPQALWPEAYGGISGCPVFALRKPMASIEFVGISVQANESFHIITCHHADLIAGNGTFAPHR
jgi:hypothetical protein